jgi:alanine dehydrogenase
VNVGVVTEIKPAERRVALTPAGVRELVPDGHGVHVQSGAGEGSGFTDAAYVGAGATIGTQADVWEQSDLLVKVKDPIAPEYRFLRRDQVLFAYLHLAADPALTDALVAAGTCAIAYETVEDSARHLPLLAPMSEIAGRLAALAGAVHLQGPHGGRGVLIGGAPGVAPARVLVLGGGTAGTHAARVAVGMGAAVTILERSLPRIRQLVELFDGKAEVLMSDAETLEAQARRADVVIGAVLVPGASAPRLITREILASMAEGSVLVAVAIDQGGFAETSRPTTYDEPTYVVDGVVHYCVANMPGAVASTSTRALTNATLPYVRTLAAFGVDKAIAADAGLGAGVNVRDGEIVCAPVAAAHQLALAAG